MLYLSEGETSPDGTDSLQSLIVRLADPLDPDPKLDQALELMRGALGATLTGRAAHFGFEFWDLAQPLTAETLKALSGTDWYQQAAAAISYVQNDLRLSAADITPNDPRYDDLWGLENTGQTGGQVDADIDIEDAWSTATGAGVLVAVIDTGIDYTHPDLNDNIWTNPGEIAGNGRDDDGNGYVDDIHGYDFAYRDSNPMDGDGHGTHVAGTIAAEAENGIGVIGVAPGARIMALKFLDDEGSGSTSDAILALEYAVQMGAQISNNSWGGGGYNQALLDAITLAGQGGHLFVAAAGNDGSDNDAQPSYPASYTGDSIISVAATDHNDRLAGFSNFGRTSVDVAAPGVDILSTLPGNRYGELSGTSMATPHVTGIAALMLEDDPTLTPAEIRQRLIQSSDPRADLQSATLSGGRVNAAAALVEPEPGSLSGTIFVDQNLDGMRTPGEATLSGVSVFLDLDGDGTRSAGEPSRVTGSDGFYRFRNIDAGIYAVVIEEPPGFTQGTQQGAPTYATRLSTQSGGPSYDWQDIRSIGQSLSLGDDDTRLVSLSHALPFFGQDMSEIYIGSNGILSFGSGITDYDNRPLPTGGSADGVIAPLWDDLNPSSNEIYYHQDPGTHRLTLQYQGVSHYGGSAEATFQTIMETDGTITFQYRQIDESGFSPTIGLEDPRSGQAVEVPAATILDRDQLAVEFTPTRRMVVEVSNGETVEDVDFALTLAGGDMGEVGQMRSVGPGSHQLTFSRSYVDPVVFVFPHGATPAAPVAARMISIEAGSARFELTGPQDQPNVGTMESLTYVVLEKGLWQLADGRLIEVGASEVAGTTASGLQTVPLSFATSPVILTQVQDSDTAGYVQSRTGAVTATGFDVALELEEARNPQGASGTVGWLAIEDGVGDWGGLLVEATHARTGSTALEHAFDGAFEDAPELIASLASIRGSDPASVRVTSTSAQGTVVQVQEDRSADTETAHTRETINLLAFSGTGILRAQSASPNQASGQVWNDVNRNGRLDDGETGVPGWTVYTDTNLNGAFDDGELFTITDSEGRYRFVGLPEGDHRIRTDLPPGWIQSAPVLAAGYTVEALGDDDQWQDISATGTRLNNIRDDDFRALALPFSFDFYGDLHDEVLVSSNGYLTFGLQATSYTNSPLPSQDAPNALIAGFWDDLDPSSGGEIYTLSESDRVVVQYQDVARYSGAGSYTFQIELASDGEIQLRYRDMSGILNTATVGIENATGTEGEQIFHEDAANLNGTGYRLFNSGAAETLGHDVTLGPDTMADGLDFGGYSSQTIMAEFGRIEALSNRAVTIELEHRFTNPVIFALPASRRGQDPVVTRILEDSPDSFTLRLQEPNSENGVHTNETVSYLVVEAGQWELDNGMILEVGELATSRLTSSGFETIDFAMTHETAPLVLSQVQTFTGRDFVQTRQHRVTTEGVRIAMEEEEALNGGAHLSETVGYLAMEQGAGRWSGHQFEAVVAGNTVSHRFSDVEFATGFDETPQFLAAMQTTNGRDPAGLRYRNLNADSVDLQISEDRSLDDEVSHVGEIFGYLAIEGSGTLSATPVATTAFFDDIA